MSKQYGIDFNENFNSIKNSTLKFIEDLSINDPDINTKLTKVSEDIQNLRTILHDTISILPSYSIKKRQEEISHLEKILKEKESSLVPKKKFGFKKKMETVALIDEEKSDKDIKLKNELIKPSLTETDNFLTIQDEGQGFHCITYEENQLNKNDTLVKNLKNVDIHLNGSPSSLRISNLINCQIFCGPVFTSVFIENCEDCTFHICCQQLRTHSSKNLKIYLRVRSRAIIEDCTNIRFGPYNWDHPKSEHLHKLTGIDSSLQRYDAIDDFNWLSASPSPNWSLLVSQQENPENHEI